MKAHNYVQNGHKVNAERTCLHKHKWGFRLAVENIHETPSFMLHTAKTKQTNIKKTHT